MSLVRASFFAILVIASACKRDRPAVGQAGTTGNAQRPASIPSRFASTGWPEDAGPVIVLPSGDDEEVRLVMPELTDATLTDTSSFELDSLPHGQVTLYSRSQRATPATIVGGEGEDAPRGCKSWPSARLESYHGEGWSFGLATNVASELPLHSWSPLLVADSAAAARDVVQIAAMARGDSAFAGIPFGVRYLYRLELGNTRAVVADAVRRINTEANVREEHVLVIAERASESGRYMGAYRETERGREDEVRVPEVVGSVLLGENRRPALLVSLEYSEGSRLLLIERNPAGHWVLTWRSAYSGC